MKIKFLLPVLLAAWLPLGCSKQDAQPESKAAQAQQQTARQDGSAPPSPPPSNLNHLLQSNGTQRTPTSAGSQAEVPLETDAEKADELADYSEKVFTKWNEALKQFRAKEKRFPAALGELQKFEPKLASLPPPRGFALQLDQQLGEINVVRATAAAR